MKLDTPYLKLGCLNIEKYRHIDRVIPALIEADLDVICIQEMPEDAVGRFERMLDASAYYVTTWRYAFLGQVEKGYGLAILARRGVAVSCDHFLYHPASEFDRPYPQNCVLQYLAVEKDGHTYHIGNTHFMWTPDGLPNLDQYRNIRALFNVIEEKFNAGIILCGDFNAPRMLMSGERGPIWGMIAERLRDNIPPNVVTTLDQKFHRARPIYLVVDGIFTSRHYEVYDVELIDEVSDHQLIAGKIVHVL